MAPSRIKITSKRQITIPVAICKAMGLEKGDELEVLQEPSGILLRKAHRFPQTTQDSSIFQLVGAAEGPGGAGAESHHELIAEEAEARDRR